MFKKLPRLPLPACVCACFLLLVQSCKEKKHETSSGGYKTLVVSPGRCVMEKEYSATLKGVQSVEVRPQVSGTITEIRVGECERVRRGEVMFVIDQAPYRAALQTAEAAEANARLTLKSKGQLHAEGVVSDFDVAQARNDLASAEAARDEAKAALASARNDLSYTEVKSPVDGVAGMMPYRVGALVSLSVEEPLTVVSDNSRVYAYFSVTEAEMQRLIADHGSLERAMSTLPKVGLRMSDGTEYEGQGTVDAISGNVDSEKGSVTLRATFRNPSTLLRNGGSGTLVVPFERDSAIVIPQEATYEIQDKKFVYRVVDGKAKSTEVAVEPLNDGKDYVVTAGLKAGDVIVAEASKLAAEATLESLLQQAFELENSLSALVGRAPGPIARSDIDSQRLPDALAGGVDIATLAARPDVRQAEARLKQAFYSTNKARADFYPTVTLSGSAGWTNSGGAAIANPGAWLLQAVGSLVQPLFSQGRLKAGLQVAKAQQEEAVVAFRQSLLDAGTEVNNAMAAWQTLNRKVELQERQIGALRQAVSDTEATMRHGSANYLQVVVARQSLLQAQLDALADRYSRMESVVTLYKALGGGCR